MSHKHGEMNTGQCGPQLYSNGMSCVGVFLLFCCSNSPLVDQLTGQVVGRFRDVEWGGTSLKCELSQSLWLSSACPTGQNKSVHLGVLLSLSHFFPIGTTFHQYDRTPDRNWAVLSSPDYRWPIIGRSLLCTYSFFQ